MTINHTCGSDYIYVPFLMTLEKDLIQKWKLVLGQSLICLFICLFIYSFPTDITELYCMLGILLNAEVTSKNVHGFYPHGVYCLL